MNKQGSNGIGWCTHTWNPIRGLCPEACDYCYARRIYKRFRYDPTIRLDEKELMAPYKLKKPARIFCGSTIEMFHQNIHGKWLQQIAKVIKDNPQHGFKSPLFTIIKIEIVDSPQRYLEQGVLHIEKAILLVGRSRFRNQKDEK